MKKFDVTGMTCAACAAHVEKSVKGVRGVTDVNVSLLTNSMTVEYAAPATDSAIIEAVKKGGYGARPEGEKAENPAVEKGAEMVLRRLIISAALLVPLMYMTLGGPVPLALKRPMLMGIAQLFLALPVIYLNRDYYIDGYRALFHGAPNMSSLIAIGSSAGLFYSLWTLLRVAYMLESGGEIMAMYHFESSAMILTLITLGKYLEARAKDSTSDAISKLVSLAPRTASVLRNGEEIEIPADELVIGDICAVRDGGMIPADGAVLTGHGSVDMSMLTGESLPVDISAGDKVTGATVNKEGYFTFRVEKVGKDTAFSKIIQLVEAAASSKAPVSRLVDRVSYVFVPCVMALALVAGAAWLIFGGGFERALQAAISVLVVSCPCALGLATPTAIMVGTGRGAELGIMIKSAAALETASHIKTAAFDKTGTLTEGGMSVSDMTAIGMDAMELRKIAAAVEALSSHPIAKAITAYGGEGVPAATDYESVPGRGVRARVDGREVAVGSAEWVGDAAPLAEWADARRETGATVMFVSVDGKLAGAFSLSDALRPEGVAAVKALREMGIRTLMLTGDNERTARAIAAKVGVDEVRAGLLPGDKERIIAKTRESGRVMMVGDGINDAPALTRADLGVAVAKGADVAIESADCVLVRDDPSLSAGAVALGRATMRNIKENLFWACIYNALMIPIAAGALSNLGVNMNPMLAAGAMSVSSLCVVTNALRLRRFKFGEKKEKINMKRIVKIEGMMCQNCVKHVKKALEGIGLTAEVVLEKNCAYVEGSASDAEIISAVTDAGYEVKGIE